MAEVNGEATLGLRERKKQRTRATLIDAAVELCERQGFDRTTVDQIAAIADVSPRTFSRYFATKDAIALALDRRGAGQNGASNWPVNRASSTTSKRC